jgi:hypothetical protein
MMAVITGSQRIQTSFTQTKSTGVITPLSLGATIGFTPNYGNGTGANQVDLMYSAAVTLASTTSVLDLTSLTDLAGAAVNMARVRELIIQSTDTTLTKLLKFYAASSNGWTFIPLVATFLTIPAGGCLHMSDPLSVGAGVGLVTGGASKVITIDSVAQTCTYNIIIAGCSAAT